MMSKAAFTENYLNNSPQGLFACKNIFSIRRICTNKMPSQTERGPETRSIYEVNRLIILLSLSIWKIPFRQNK